MKMNTKLAMTALILSSGLALAAGQEQGVPQPDTEGSMATGAMTGVCMPMHEHMQEMQSQIDAIYQAEDPDRRAELIQAHLDSMNEMMKMTKGMHDGQAMTDQDMEK